MYGATALKDGKTNIRDVGTGQRKDDTSKQT